MPGIPQYKQALQEPYERARFINSVLHPLFESRLKVLQRPANETAKLTATEKKLLQSVQLYATATLDDGAELRFYEVVLQTSVRPGHSKVGIQQYLRKLLTVGQSILVSFVQPDNRHAWRLSFIAADSQLTEKGEVQAVKTHARRYTYLLGPDEACRTAAERFAGLETAANLTLEGLTKAFSVETLSKSFFDEYKRHYADFIEYLYGSGFMRSVFKKDEKAVRDFVKKTLGRIVFLCFVQKKGWLGASTTAYADGDPDFLMNLYRAVPDDTFYTRALSPLFFRALNTERTGDDYKLPGGKKVKVPFLNGGLFEEGEHDSALLTFPVRLFHTNSAAEDPRRRGFLDFLGAYNFTIYEDSPDEHTVAVDPEMLGHIFENLLEDNKDKGAYYTPKAIVHYMCGESLIEYLYARLNPAAPTAYQTLGQDQADLFGNSSRSGQGKLEQVHDTPKEVVSREALEALIKDSDATRLTGHEAEALQALRDVKICDPAIGSGAFPMGILQEVFHAVHLLAMQAPDAARKIWELKHGWNPAAVKAAIIQNSIYGVDIEQGAVDIARLRFWLSLVVDEELPQPLPNLDYKIVVGNSLLPKLIVGGREEVVEIDWELATGGKNVVMEVRKKLRGKLLSLQEKQRAYFAAKAGKAALHDEIEALKIDILLGQLGINRMSYAESHAVKGGFAPTAKDLKENRETKAVLDGYDDLIRRLEKAKREKVPVQLFDWKLAFPEVMVDGLAKGEARFDIAIGNPPYIQLQKLGAYADELQKRKFKTFARTGDIYCLFYEAGFGILKRGGILNYITSNTWMRAAYGEPLRKYLLEQTNPVRLLDFGNYQVFENVTVNINILIGQNAVNQRNIQTCLIGKAINGLDNLSVFVRQHTTVQKGFKAESGWVVLGDLETGIKEKIERLGVPLREWDVQINYGIKTGFNDAFIIDTETKDELIRKSPKNAEIIRPIILGKNLKRYAVDWQGDWLINTHNGLRAMGVPAINVSKDYPTIYSYLSEFKPDIEKRADQGNHWTNLRNCAYLEEFDRPKIVWGNLTLNPQFAFVESGYFINAPAPFIATDNLYLLAVLNSKVCEFYIRNLGIARSGGYLEYKPMYVEQLPVPQIEATRQAEFVRLVRQVLQKRDNGHDTATEEKTIDSLVYRLYNLSDEEVRVLNRA